jgi:hypothetical protein
MGKKSGLREVIRAGFDGAPTDVPRVFRTRVAPFGPWGFFFWLFAIPWVESGRTHGTDCGKLLAWTCEQKPIVPE